MQARQRTSRGYQPRWSPRQVYICSGFQSFRRLLRKFSYRGQNLFRLVINLVKNDLEGIYRILIQFPLLFRKQIHWSTMSKGLDNGLPGTYLWLRSLL